jgi:CRP-like cAMP-binding protein
MVLSALLHPGGGREAQLAHALRRVPLLRDAPARDLVALWRMLRQEQVAAGQVICRRGEPGDRFYVVQAGSVEVRLGTGPQGTGLYELGPGDFFGEMALLTGGPRSADVVAREETILWALDRADFDRILKGSLQMLRALNRSLAERLYMATAVIEETQASASARGPAGPRFGPYRVVAQLGVGGMAAVYSATHVETKAAVAVKVLPAAWGDAPELRARLEREAAILQRIDHPSVVRLLDVGNVAERLGGGCYLAMEWLPHALDRVLRAQYPEPLGTTVALRVARDISDALGAVHAAGLIHRDVKSSNVLLRADGRPVLTDFGLAAALGDLATAHRLTPRDVIIGTADYLAPEQIAGEDIDGRVDLYALGCVLYEMLTGFVPFAGRDPLETLRAQVEEVPPPLPVNVPSNVRAIVERCLQKRPADRFASATDLTRAIDAALSENRE